MSALNGGGKVIELLDGPHVVKFTTNLLITCEDEFGSLDGIELALNTKPFRSTRFLLWVLLGQDRPLDAVGDLIDLAQLKTVADGLAAALGDAIGSKPDEPVPVDPTPGAAPTPSPSS